MTSVIGLTDEDRETFIDAMTTKCSLLHGDWVSPSHLRALVEAVVIDTEMLLDGSVPLEMWRDNVTVIEPPPERPPWVLAAALGALAVVVLAVLFAVLT